MDCRPIAEPRRGRRGLRHVLPAAALAALLCLRGAGLSQEAPDLPPGLDEGPAPPAGPVEEPGLPAGLDEQQGPAETQPAEARAGLWRGETPNRARRHAETHRLGMNLARVGGPILPEPAALSLLAIGALGVVARRRRR